MQTRVLGIFAVVLAVGPALGGSLDPQTDGPAPVLDGLAWELRQRGVTADEPDIWVQESGDRMVGDLTFVDDEDATTARIEAGTGDATLGRLTAASADIAGELTCTGCVNDPDVDFAYAASATKGGPALNADNLDGLDSSQFLRSDGDAILRGSLEVQGGVSFDGQKVCAMVNAVWERLLVPQTWTPSTCGNFAWSFGHGSFVLMCLFDDSFSRGALTPFGTLPPSALPSPNCGW